MTLHEWMAEWASWGWAFAANHLWQATMFSVVALIVAVMLRRGPARARYTVWLIASIKFAIPAILFAMGARSVGLDFSAIKGSTSGAAAVVTYQIVEPATGLTGQTIADTEIAITHNEIYCAMTIIWLTGCATVLGFWSKRRRQFSRALRAGKMASHGREAETLTRVQSWLAIKRKVRLVVSPQITEPGVWRIFRPVIVLPESIADHLSEAELEAVMMHEMVHIARWDNLVSNLQMALCCLFWFHPLVWLIDRRMLAERERACDDRVIELGGASKVYAATLLKVLRFCLGAKTAGVSYATGSNLKRRIERIMASDIDRKLNMPQRALIIATAVTVIVFSVAAGAPTGDGIIAQSGQTTESRANADTDNIAHRMPQGAVVEVPSEPSALRQDSAQKVEDFVSKIEQAPETVISFKNDDKAPMTITDARVKAAMNGNMYLKSDGSWSATIETYIFKPRVTIINNTAKRITRLTLNFINKESKGSGFGEYSNISIDPYGTYVFGDSHRMYLSLPGDPASLIVELLTVRFEDGSYWHSSTLPPPPPVLIERGPPPPPPPPAAEAPPEPPEPLFELGSNVVHKTSQELKVIKSARPVYSPLARAARVSGEVTLDLLIDEEGNVEAVKVNSGHPLLRDAAIETARQYRFEPPTLEGKPIKAMTTLSISFALSSPPPPAEPPRIIRKSGGVLQGSALKRVQPSYPQEAKEMRVSGSVVVEVVIDEEGKVMSARAISGHELLRDAAVRAAWQWKFTPVSLSGEPVKVIGTITFMFQL